MKIKVPKLFQLLFGFMLSSIFLYLTFSEVDLKKMLSQTQELNFLFLLISLFLALVSLIIRSIRWARILHPLIQFNQKIILPISSIGIAAITILPLRLGEFVRPYLLSKAQPVSFSLALASIVFERLIDSLMLLLLLLLIVIFSSLPQILITGSKFLFIFLPIIFFLLLIIYKNKNTSKKVLEKFTFYLPNNLKNFLFDFFDKFFDGMLILSSTKDLIKVVIQSLILWLIYCLIVFSMFSFHNFDLPYTATLAVVTFTFLASSLPAAPGLLGTFQYGSFLALTSYGVDADQAALFSITYYLVMIGMNITLGSIYFLKEYSNGIFSVK
tara:strand:+ start:3786 stop:4766 length:981 start_codon:yes stop_codon:yes gene_type:complete